MYEGLLVFWFWIRYEGRGTDPEPRNVDFFFGRSITVRRDPGISETNVIVANIKAIFIGCTSNQFRKTVTSKAIRFFRAGSGVINLAI